MIGEVLTPRPHAMVDHLLAVCALSNPRDRELRSGETRPRPRAAVTGEAAVGVRTSASSIGRRPPGHREPEPPRGRAHRARAARWRARPGRWPAGAARL